MNYQECNVVILPTEKTIDYPFLGLYYDNGKQSLVYVVSNTTNSALTQPQHLYITNPNEEIKEGDWVMYFTSPMFCFKVNEESIWLRKKDSNSKLVGKEECSRIIATTDESLKIKVNDYSIGTIHYAGYEGVMARPSNKFLKKFCEVSGIWEVLVEYERDLIEYSCSVAFDGNYEGQCPICKKQEHWMGTGGMKCYNHFKLKVKPDNTITIKPIKDSWSREEVIEILRKSHEDYHEHPNDLENWIKENL